VFNETDVAISGAGQSFHELAYAGIPTLAIGIDTDQTPNLNYYFKQDFLKERFYWDQPNLIPNLCEAFNALDYEDRTKRSQNGKALVQGEGAKNIFEKVASLTEQ
jgi:spore coat polysaccharide biosynthesis predicted glycosyltransferase SpsG